jgi:phospholipid transport system transporter-binding protein
MSAAAMPADVAVSVESVAADEFAVRGELSFVTAARAHAAGCALLQRGVGSEMRIDCSGIETADSAGLAVLLDWLAVASRRGLPLRFLALPLPLQQLARIGGVSELLGVNAARG